MSHAKSQQSKTLKELSAIRLQPRTGARKRRASSPLHEPSSQRAGARFAKCDTAPTGSRWSSNPWRCEESNSGNPLLLNVC
jgi:hypothetical protein